MTQPFRGDSGEPIVDIKKSWSAFTALPFPDGYAGEEIDGVCLVELDTFAAGCVATFISTRGRIDVKRIGVLDRCAADLSWVLPKLEGDAEVYFGRLNELVIAVLNECRR